MAALVCTPQEFARIERLAEDLAGWSVHEDAERYVTRAQVLWRRMPPRFQEAVADFQRLGALQGALHLAGMPTGAVPPTPQAAELAADSAPIAAATLSVMAGLGEQFGFAAELSGRIVQGVVPVQGAKYSERSISSLHGLAQHVETSFTKHRADHVGLCLRPDHDGVAGTTIASVQVLRQLPADTVAVLRQPRFETAVDDSLLVEAGGTMPTTVGAVHVFSGPAARPRLQVDFAGSRGTEAAADAAQKALADVATRVMRTIYLEAGGILLIDDNLREICSPDPRTVTSCVPQHSGRPAHEGPDTCVRCTPVLWSQSRSAKGPARATSEPLTCRTGAGRLARARTRRLIL